MRMLNEFPAHRRTAPKRRAEMEVYDQLAASDAAGTALYEVKATREAPELDFLVWLEGKARFGIQVKGGCYSVQGGRWFLHTDGRREPIPDPVKQTWDGSMSIRDALWEQGGYKTFMIAVLAFPDMAAPDPQIQEWAANSRVHTLWGVGDLVERLMDIDEVGGIYSPPNARYIEEELAVLMPEWGEGEAARPDPAPVGVSARQVVIQHADVVNVYTVAAVADDGGVAADCAG